MPTANITLHVEGLGLSPYLEQSKDVFFSHHCYSISSWKSLLMQLRWEKQIKNILIRKKEILLSVLVDDMITGKKIKDSKNSWN